MGEEGDVSRIDMARYFPSRGRLFLSFSKARRAMNSVIPAVVIALEATDATSEWVLNLAK